MTTRRLLHALAIDAPALVQAFADAAAARRLTVDAEASHLAALLIAAYPALRTSILASPDDVVAIAGRMRTARDLRAYRRLVLPFLTAGRTTGAASPASSLEGALARPDVDVRRGLRRFAHRERLRVAARELLSHEGGGDVDTTSRELSDLAQVCIEVALAEATRWATTRFGPPLTAAGERAAFTILGMGKLGGRELNAGSDVDLLLFYETDDGAARAANGDEVTLHEYFSRVTQRLTATLEDVTEDGICWRVDLRLRPEGSRGPLVNALAAAERYYETWGRTWERAALIRARPVAGDVPFGERVLTALGPFVWRRVVDPKLAHEMAELVVRARAELTTEPERDLKLGPGGIREAEFFVQSLQLIWGGKEPRIRHSNTLAALRRLRARGLVTDRECREVEGAYVALRRLEHRVQFATNLQTHALPRGELLDRIARTVGQPSGLELEREVERIRRRVSARFASLIEMGPSTEAIQLAPLFAALDEAAAPSTTISLDGPRSTRTGPTADEGRVLAALTEAGLAADFGASLSADLARHLLTLARRPDYPLGGNTRDRHPDLAHALLVALADAADPEQAARLLASFFMRLSTPGVYVRAMASDRQVLRRLVGLFGASAFLGETLVFHPELVESALFAKGVPTPTSVRRAVDAEVDAAAEAARGAPEDADELFVGALRRAKARAVMEVGLAELSGELQTREATLVLSALADATLQHATARALAERGLDGGLSVVAMGKLGGREIGYGSDLDIFFVYEPGGGDGDASDDARAERYIRAAQRVLRLVSAPHGQGPGYELDTRLRPSGSHGLLVVTLEGFARYHGVSLDDLDAPWKADPADPRAVDRDAQDWERQALVRARPCAGDPELGQRVLAVAARAAYGRPAPPADRVHHLRVRMERELARESRSRFDVKLGRGGLVDIEFAVQWLQMKHGADTRLHTSDTEAALGALEAGGYLEPNVAAVLREGYAFLRRLEQALRVVHGTSASLIEEGAPGLVSLARRLGFREGPGEWAGARPSTLSLADPARSSTVAPPAPGDPARAQAESPSRMLLRRYQAVTHDVRAAYLWVLGLAG